MLEGREWGEGGGKVKRDVVEGRGWTVLGFRTWRLEIDGELLLHFSEGLLLFCPVRVLHYRPPFSCSWIFA